VLELALALIIFAAFIHAVWNFLTKRSSESLAFVWWMYSLGALGYGLIVLPVTGIHLASASVLPFIVSSVAEAGYVLTLIRGYGKGDLSLVYPISRGGAPILTVMFAAVLGERLPLLGLLGIFVSVAGVCFLTLSEISPAKGKLSILNRGSTWALICAVCIAVYSVSDNIVVVSTPPIIYIWWVFMGNTILTLPFVWRSSRVRNNLSELRSNWRLIIVASLCSLFAYLAILFALTLTSVSYVVTGRALSVLLAAVLGVLLLKEKFGKWRILGAALMIFGLAIIQFFGS
jgi:drug/metabolite transporter (DMT)-like permease